MYVNDYIAMELQRIRESELATAHSRSHQRALLEIINEFKAERSRRNRKERRG
jgi:hypothetical protein